MVERKIIVDHLTITYKGLFSVTELYKLVDFWLMEKGYTKHELQSFEEAEPDSKSIYVMKEPYKKITDYAKYIIRIEISGNNISEVDVEKGKYKLRLNKGECIVSITGYLETDYDERWQQKAIYYFIRGIFDKYVWRVHTYRYEAGLADESHHLASQVRAFFNLYRYQENV